MGSFPSSSESVDGGVDSGAFSLSATSREADREKYSNRDFSPLFPLLGVSLSPAAEIKLDRPTPFPLLPRANSTAPFLTRMREKADGRWTPKGPPSLFLCVLETNYMVHADTENISPFLFL